MASTVYLITGANRGIGRGFVTNYLSTPNAVVVACVRNPLDETSTSLQDLPKGKGSRLIIVQMDLADEFSIKAAMHSVSRHNIDRIDVVIANAAVGGRVGALIDTTHVNFRDHVEVNAWALVLLFRETLALLQNSPTPKFVSISSYGASQASIPALTDVPIGLYTASKCLGNFLVRRLSIEHKDICAFSLAPGFVATTMADAAGGVSEDGPAGAMLKLLPLLTPAESVGGMSKIISLATLERHSGRFLNYSGEELAW
ncbi:hypothetical protein BJY01DRAFT_255215 [Aspergillus pseudoustus]|uniref:NAD(P)-binding protein n=1 Tax=Aspergillus pseudoustus TaxID=1810923 RepID=A0ABR4IMK6_9EURO